MRAGKNRRVRAVPYWKTRPPESRWRYCLGRHMRWWPKSARRVRRGCCRAPSCPACTWWRVLRMAPISSGRSIGQIRGHRVEAKGLALPLRSVPRLAQDQGHDLARSQPVAVVPTWGIRGRLAWQAITRHVGVDERFVWVNW